MYNRLTNLLFLVSMLQFLWSYSRDVSYLRAVYLAAQPRTGAASTVMVTDIPGIEYGTVIDRVRLLVYVLVVIWGAVERGRGDDGAAKGSV